jgi:phosphonopyruvate decarboxylase
LIVTLRGEPGVKDEPQHELMGQITGAMFDTLRIPYAEFPFRSTDVKLRISRAVQVLKDTHLPYGLLMHKNSVRDDGLDQNSVQADCRCSVRNLSEHADRPTRFAAMERLLGILPDDAAIVATTGKCGRELFTLADRPQHLYMVGSMGCASAVGMGIAVNIRRLVVVLDGDGAALMKLGNIATIGVRHPPNFLQIILDNGVHDSTGGQLTVSSGVEFASVAAACGYAMAFTVDSLGGLEVALRTTLQRPGPHLVHVRIKPGSMKPLGRPTIAPKDVARRFKSFLNTCDNLRVSGRMDQRS